jgi:POT family proton-dependent oligopeptide transporter
MTDVTGGDAPVEEKLFLGHPRGLVTLFFTEMWERFSFYGMRALLVIYLTQHFLFSDDKAQGLYGAYAALVYLIPVIGGVIADRFLGARKAVTIGAVLLVLGHFGMAFEGSGSRQYLDVNGESYRVEAVGRGDDRQLHIDLPDGRHHLRFQVDRRLMLLNDAQGSRGFEPAATPPSDPAEESAWLAANSGRYLLVAETPSFLYTFCGTIGLSCAPAPTTQLVVIGEGEYPVEARGEQSIVELGGLTYVLAETATSSAVAFDPGPTEAASDDTVVRTIPETAYESRVEQEPLFVQILFFSLALIIVGVGFLKANISTTVGSLYAEGDPRRDGGFTIFYMGINLGAFFATILCGWLGQTYGWKYGFGLAGVGMLFGLGQYLMGQKWLKGKADPPRPVSAAFEGFFWMAGIIAVIPAWLLVQQSELMEQALPIFVPLLFLAVLIFVFLGFKGLERGRLIAALVMTFFSVVFWMLFEQAGSSLSLFAERSTDLTIVPGVTMTAAQTQSFNAGFIVLLALPFSAMWIWLAKRKMEPSTPVKFALGLLQVGLGFFVLVLGAQPELSGGGGDYRVPLIFLALLYLLHTTGELFLSPVGLSMITKLSPARVVGLMMGVWFLSSSLAHILAAIIAQRTSSETIGGEVVDPAAQLQTYVQVFTSVGVVGIAAGLLLLLLSPIVKRWIGPPV